MMFGKRNPKEIRMIRIRPRSVTRSCKSVRAKSREHLSMWREKGARWRKTKNLSIKQHTKTDAICSIDCWTGTSRKRLSYNKLSCVSPKGDTVYALAAASPLSRSVSKQPLKPRSARNVRNLGKLLSSALLRPTGLARALQQVNGATNRLFVSL